MSTKNLPMMTVSGIRGKFGETLDEMFFARVAFIQTKIAGGGWIVIGRDTRPTGELLMRAAARGIRAAGGTPVDIGIAPTPTVCVAVEKLCANGGIIITASHNPLPYNGYKMVHKSGRLCKGEECENVYAKFHAGDYPSDSELLQHENAPAETVDAVSIHVAKILAMINADVIRSKKICVAVDSINGAAGAIFPILLDKLGVTWYGVHNKLDGDFVHNPEPRPEHLCDLRDLLKSGCDKSCDDKNRADKNDDDDKSPHDENHTAKIVTDKNNCGGFWGGFAFDPDADRLATMGECGQDISEEMTLVFALQNLLPKINSDVATNLSTSMLIDDVAARHGVNVIRTKIGEANVVEGMLANKCLVGGEGNGGVIYPAISTVRDGLAAMAIILELMASTNKKLNALASDWPAYHIVKDKISCDGIDPSALIAKLSNHFSAEKLDMTDGLKIIRPDGWVHLRASNTEPIIRCYAEAKTPKTARDLADMVLGVC